MTSSRRIYHASFSLTGAGTTNVLLDALDFSNFRTLRIHFSLTSAATDAGDTLDTNFQFYDQNSDTWNIRARFLQYLGTATVSASAPETHVLTVSQEVVLGTTEKGYEPSGSAGATATDKGTVIDGSFPGLYRTTAGRQPNARLQFIVADAGTVNAAFAGAITIWGLSEV